MRGRHQFARTQQAAPLRSEFLCTDPSNLHRGTRRLSSQERRAPSRRPESGQFGDRRQCFLDRGESGLYVEVVYEPHDKHSALPGMDRLSERLAAEDAYPLGDPPSLRNTIKYHEDRHNATNNYSPRSENNWSKTAFLAYEAISARERDQDGSEGRSWRGQLCQQLVMGISAQ
jgi:hypothetical protein